MISINEWASDSKINSEITEHCFTHSPAMQDLLSLISAGHAISHQIGTLCINVDDGSMLILRGYPERRLL